MDTAAAERVGRYQLLEPIGVGPNGTVARAKVFGVAGFERQFAVKKFFPELTITAAMAQSLSAAARSYGSLEHPRIARMAEFGVSAGQTFTAVEYVAGLDALRLINETRLGGLTLPAGGALGLVSQAARAVGYAHGRGLAHLGLAPTNVIINAEGDVKITDFNILQATLPQRAQPGMWEDGPIGGLINGRLANRVMYLAPEQIAGEATSAATDVWSLGVIGYEMITGQRAFKGENAAAIANAVMAAAPAEPNLPRPIVRVLQRCLARSPFERFPDARALADAIDAALRVAPVPGTRKDIGASVGELVDRLAALHDGQMSGVLAINSGTGPYRRESAPDVATLGRDSEMHMDLSTSEFVRPDLQVAGPAPMVGPRLTPSTIPGIPPPAIPPIPPMRPTTQPPPAKTLMGIEGPAARPGTNPRFPVNPTTNVGTGPILRPPARGPASPTGEPLLPGVMKVYTPAPTDPGVGPESPPPRKRTPTDEKPTAEMVPLAPLEPTPEEPAPRRAGSTSVPPPGHGMVLPPPLAPGEIEQLPQSKRKGNKLPWILGGIVLLGGLGFVGWQIYDVMQTDDGPTAKPVKTPADAAQVATAPPDATQLATTPADAPQVTKTPPLDAAVKLATAPDAAPPIDAAQVATVPIDAAAKPIDAAQVAVIDAGKPPGDAAQVATAPIDAGRPIPTGDGSSLVVDSTPHGARVFLDGADAGVTPLKLPASGDKHTIALILAAHDLYVAQIDGKGTFTIPLKDVTPSNGPAGIKVIKCKDTVRYFVYVDGKPTGQTCPTERIGTTVGPHTVEVYDAVTDSRKKWDIVVADERLSFRVRIE